MEFFMVLMFLIYIILCNKMDKEEQEQKKYDDLHDIIEKFNERYK